MNVFHGLMRGRNKFNQKITNWRIRMYTVQCTLVQSVDKSRLKPTYFKFVWIWYVSHWIYSPTATLVIAFSNTHNYPCDYSVVWIIIIFDENIFNYQFPLSLKNKNQDDAHGYLFSCEVQQLIYRVNNKQLDRIHSF